MFKTKLFVLAVVVIIGVSSGQVTYYTTSNGVPVDSGYSQTYITSNTVPVDTGYTQTYTTSNQIDTPVDTGYTQTYTTSNQMDMPVDSYTTVHKETIYTDGNAQSPTIINNYHQVSNNNNNQGRGNRRKGGRGGILNIAKGVAQMGMGAEGGALLAKTRSNIAKNALCG